MAPVKTIRYRIMMPKIQYGDNTVSSLQAKRKLSIKETEEATVPMNLYGLRTEATWKLEFRHCTGAVSNVH